MLSDIYLSSKKVTTLSSIYKNDINKNLIYNGLKNIGNKSENDPLNDACLSTKSRQNFLNKYNISNSFLVSSKINFLSHETEMYLIHSYYTSKLPYHINTWDKTAIYFQDELHDYLTTLKNTKDNRIIFHSSNTHFFSFEKIEKYLYKSFYETKLKEEYSILTVNLRRKKSYNDSKFIFSNSVDNNINLYQTYKDKYYQTNSYQTNSYETNNRQVNGFEINKDTDLDKYRFMYTAPFDNNYLYKMPVTNKYNFYILIPRSFQDNEYFIYLVDNSNETVKVIFNQKGYFKYTKNQFTQSFNDSCQLLMSLNCFSYILDKHKITKQFNQYFPKFVSLIEKSFDTI